MKTPIQAELPEQLVADARASLETSGRERFLPSVEMTGMGYCCHSERM